jgi:hypothetical protein
MSGNQFPKTQTNKRTDPIKGIKAMNFKLTPLLPVAAFALALSAHSVLAQPKGEDVTIKGEVIDLWCYLEGGDHGADHKACGVKCII